MSCVNLVTFIPGDLSEIWDTTSSVSVVSSPARYTGGKTLKLGPYQAGNSGLGVGIGAIVGGVQAAASVATSHVRFFWRCDGLTADSICEFTYGGGNTRKARVFVSGGVWRIADSTGAVTAAATGPATGTWYRVEVKVGTGTSAPLELKIDGTVAATTATANLTANNTTRVALGQPSAAATMASFYYCDFCWDDAGYPGDGRGIALYPTGAGTYSAWTGSYADVDDIPPATGSHIEAAGNPGDISSFALKDTGLGSGTTINGVKHYMTATWAASGPPVIAAFVRSGGTDAVGPDITPDTSWGVFQWVLATNPAGGAWTPAALDAAEAGAKYTGSSGPPAWVGDVYLLIDALPPAATTVTRSHAADVLPLRTTTRSHGTSCVLSGPLVGHWKLDEGTGTTAADSSPVANTGTLMGDAAWTATAAPIPNNPRAIALAGSGYVNTPSPPPPATNINAGGLFAWVKTPNAGAGYHGVVVKQLAFGMFLVDNVPTIFDWYTSTPHSTGVNVADDAWHHVGFVFQHAVTNGMAAYIDGARRMTATTYVADHANGIVIGAGRNLGDIQLFSGIVDDVRLYRTVLTDDQVSSLAHGSDPLTVGRVARSHFADAALWATPSRSHGTSCTVAGPLVGWWKFDDAGSASYMLDSSPLGAHAYPLEGTTTPDSPAPVLGSTDSRAFPGGTSLDAGPVVAHSLTDNFTVSIWVKGDNYGGYGSFMTHQSSAPLAGWGLVTSANIIPSFIAFTGDSYEWLDIDAPAVIGVWHSFIGLVRDGARYMYWDGVRQSRVGGYIPSANTVSHTVFGKFYDNVAGYFWPGSLDDARIYRMPLGDDQISSLAHGNDPLTVAITTRSQLTDAKCRGSAIRAHATDVSLWWTRAVGDVEHGLYTTQTPTVEVVQSSLELGTVFHSDRPGSIVGVRFWRAASLTTAAITVSLWDAATQARLAGATGGAGQTLGWTAVYFAAPVPIVAAHDYVVSYHTPGTTSYTGTPTKDVGPLHAANFSGVYIFSGTVAYPPTASGSDYFVDPLFVGASGHATDIYLRSGLVGTRSRTGRVGTRTPAFGG